MEYFKNLTTRKQFDIDYDRRILYTYDLGTIPANFTTSKGVDQIGESVLHTDLGPRPLEFVCYLKADSQEEMDLLERSVRSFFNPLQKFQYVDTIKDRVISFQLKNTPDIKDNHADDTSYLLEFDLSATAYEPCYRAIDSKSVQLAQWIKKFKFPMVFDSITFATREQSLIKNIYNPGDLPCGMLINFQAHAAIKNPGILNANTREYFQFDHLDMQSGDVVTVDTENQSADLLRGGAHTDISNCVDPDCDYLQLNAGDNVLRYYSDTNTDSLDCGIAYDPIYL